MSLTQTELVHFVRPSADLLFESVAAGFRERSLAAVLSGTGSDGSMGLTAVKKMGGTTIAQDERTSEFFGMPKAAVETGAVDFVLPLDEIASARIASAKHEKAVIRVWCAGSASGEEAYSIAMLLAEHLGPRSFRERVKIFATDVDEAALTIARHGRYGSKSMESVPEKLLRTYFQPVGDGLSFGPELRRSIIFGRHDLVQDAPISRTDLILCRNTLMYMNADTQSRVIANLAFSLNEGGFLVLGKSEMLFSKLPSFAPADMKRRVFVKANDGEERDSPFPWERADEASTGERLAFELGPVAQVHDRSGRQALPRQPPCSGRLGPRSAGRRQGIRAVRVRAPADRPANAHRAIATERRGHRDPRRRLEEPDGRDVIFDIQVVPLVHATRGSARSSRSRT